jgi:hypothetical protein
MNEAKQFRVKRAEGNVLRLAREWSKADTAWRAHDGNMREDNRLFDEQKALHKRLEAACHELVAVESESGT